MGELFDELCKGPVVVVDDKIGDEGDFINSLIREIEREKLPIIKYTSINKAKDELRKILFSNFIILDWKMIGGEIDLSSGTTIGAEAETVVGDEIIEFIEELKGICLAPIFIITNEAVDYIRNELKEKGISDVVVQKKSNLIGDNGILFSEIEKWIVESPHVYLAKCWTNEWLSKNTAVFWDLYELNSNWPTLFYRSFKEEQDPVLALRDTLFQLVFSEIDVSEVDPSFLDREIEQKDEKSQKESLKDLYRRLVYVDKDIDKDISPGDIFRKEGSYYLNIRPECDTTRRAGDDPKIYLLKGNIRSPQRVKASSYHPPYGIIDKENEITMPLLDGNPFVVFNKRELLVEGYLGWKDCKICRVASPFITRMRQSYSSYLGRFGVPSYPEQIVESLFESTEESSST